MFVRISVGSLGLNFFAFWIIFSDSPEFFLLIGKLIKFRTKTARKSAQSGLPSKCGRRAGTNVDADAGLLSSPVCPLLTDNGLLGV